MTLMADWTDGPEYAPLARPDAYAPSGAAALADVTAPTLAPDTPTERPEFQSGAGVPLDQLIPQRVDDRDPSMPFAVVASVMTAAGALPSRTPPGAAAAPWSGAGAPGPIPQGQPWAPQQPMVLPDLPAPDPMPMAAAHPAPQVNPQGFPTQDPAQWYTSNQLLTPPTAPVPAKSLTQAIGWPVLLLLASGGLVPFFGALGWVAPVCLIGATAVAAQRLRYRRGEAVKTLVVIGVSAVLLALLDAANASRPGVATWWSSVCGWAQAGCWVAVPALMFMVGSALRRGERPNK